MLKRVSTAAIFVVLLSSSLAVAQTKTAKQSAVGVWKLGVDATGKSLEVVVEWPSRWQHARLEGW